MKRSPRRSNGISHVTIFIDCLLNLRKSHQAIKHLKNAKFRGNSQKYVTVFMKWSTKSNILPRAELRGHTSAVRSASFSRNGERVVTASFDLTARIWETSSGRALATLQGHTGYVESAVFSPDGK